jgi:hypothetical protein
LTAGEPGQNSFPLAELSCDREELSPEIITVGQLCQPLGSFGIPPCLIKAVNLCYAGILQYVVLGRASQRPVPEDLTGW